MKKLVLFAILCAFSSVAAAADTSQPLRVAFVISEHFAMIDFAGPWEAFADTTLPDTAAPERPAYDLYTVAASTTAVHSAGGAVLVPQFTFENAPRPDLIIIPAQYDISPALLAWLSKQSAAGVTLASVCLGARQLAMTGLLDGRQATTHHASVGRYRKLFPKVQWLEGRRFVQNGPKLYTAAGLSSGIDLALHLVSEQYGLAAAIKTAQEMEYSSEAWKASATP